MWACARVVVVENDVPTGVGPLGLTKPFLDEVNDVPPDEVRRRARGCDRRRVRRCARGSD